MNDEAGFPMVADIANQARRLYATIRVWVCNNRSVGTNYIRNDLATRLELPVVREVGRIINTPVGPCRVVDKYVQFDLLYHNTVDRRVHNYTALVKEEVDNGAEVVVGNLDPNVPRFLEELPRPRRNRPMNGH